MPTANLAKAVAEYMGGISRSGSGGDVIGDVIGGLLDR
jgi:ABC-type xylose transport system permease subunit